MLIYRIHKKVQIFLNTDGRGNYSPTDFDMFLHDAIQGRNEEYIFEVNRLLNRQNRGQQANILENLPDRYREKILFYLNEAELVLDTGAYYSFPDDYRYLDSLETANGYAFEMSKSVGEFNIAKTQATIQYPIFTIAGTRIKIAPLTDEKINVSYLRQAKVPKWTFTLVNNTELFNPSSSDFQDADIHPSEEDEMVKRVLLAFGVNVKEQDIQQFAMQEKNSEFNENNQA
jgi:hypothetical protein